jgi:intein/homing endonuclease
MNLRGNEQFLKKALYPCVRVRTAKAGGSGQVIHSSEQNGTFVLSCHHVVDDAIQIKDQWSSILQKTVKKDIFSPVQIDFFKYSYKDRVTGSESKTAQIIVYDKEEDIALLRVDDPTPYPYVAELYPCQGEDDLHLEEDLDVGSEIVTVGAPLLHDPIPTVGNLVGFKDIIDNRRYWMATGPTIFGNCIPGDSLVSMADGTVREIKDIQVGDHVLAYGISGLTDKAKVEAVINSGMKQIYEVKTRNRTLRASGNHPVIKIAPVKDWTGRIRNIPVWTPVEQLEPGDVIAIMSSHLPRELGRGFNFAKEIGQHKNPEMLMRFLGFYVGDGYKRRRSDGGELQLYPYNEELGRFYERILKDLFDVNVTVVGKYEQLRVYSTKLVDKLSEWGFDGLAKTKTIPDWVMTQIAPYQMAFLQGYVEADGHVNGNQAWVFEAANEKLVKQLRMMAIHLGLQVTNVYHRNRSTVFPNGSSYEGDTWIFQAYPFYSKNPDSYFEGDRQLLPDDLQYVKISDVTIVGEAETYDIKLDHWHTFFADGVLVHNSGGGTYLADTWQFIGMPARIAVAAAMFSMDAITHMCYIVPITRIVKFLKDSMMDFLFDPSVTWEECKKRIEEKRKMTELEALLEQKVGR